MTLKVLPSLLCAMTLSLIITLVSAGTTLPAAAWVGASALPSIVLPSPISGATDGSTIEVDSTGRLHAAFEGTLDGQVIYSTCSANCSSVSGWTSVVVGTNGALGTRPILQLTPNDQPRLMYIREETSSSIPEVLVYNACDAGCTNAANWTELEVEAVNPSGATVETRLFALDGQGRPRAIVAAPSGNLIWFTCDTGCTTNAANWFYLVLPQAIGSQAALSVDAAGNPHVLYKTSDNAVSADNDILAYATCAQPCLNEANWSIGYLFLIGRGFQSRYAIDTDSASRPRVAFYTGSLVTNDPAQANVLAYGWCDAACTDGSNWGSAFVGTGQHDGWAPDLALDGSGRPHISYYNDGSGYEIGYAHCTADCETGSGAWTVGHLESPLTYPSVIQAGCQSAFWYVTAPTALALDSAGGPHILFATRNLQSCGATISEKLRYVRYLDVAGTGSGTPTPTPPPGSLTQRVYLPSLTR